MLLFLVVVTLCYNAVSMKIEKENHFRSYLFETIVTAVDAYFQAHHTYPTDLSLLHLEQQHIVDAYMESKVIEYGRDPKGSEWYTLTCRYSGMLASGKGRHRLGWSGIQYSNQKDKLPLPPGANVQPDSKGFYFADFH